MKNHLAILGILALLLGGCNEEDEGLPILSPSRLPESCPEESTIKSFVGYWGEAYDLILVEGDPNLVSEWAILRRDDQTGILLFEHQHSNGDYWSDVTIWAKPVSPCSADLYFLRGRGTGYFIEGRLDLLEDNQILIQVTRKVIPPGDVWPIYVWLVYSL